MANYILIARTSLRPDPDDASQGKADIDAGTKVEVLKELKPWTKISAIDAAGAEQIGWVHSDGLRQSNAEQVELYDEPEGDQSHVVTGDILSVRVELSSWQKIDVRLDDGSVTSGWRKISAQNADDTEDGVGGGEAQTDLSLGPNEPYRDFLLMAEKRTAIDAAALAALINAEAAKLPTGQWDQDSKAATSSAAGLTQFLSATWIGEACKATTYLNEVCRSKGLMSAQNAVAAGAEAALLKLRFDPKMSIVAAAEYGASNLKALVSAGLVDDDLGDDEKAGYIYLAHHEGLGGAIGFLKGTKSYTFSDLVTQVGRSKAQRFLDDAGGNASKAYRVWLEGYIRDHIQPSRYRRPRGSGSGFSQGATDGMRQLAQYDGPAVALTDLSKNSALAKAIQWQLSDLGYLDPPADGFFGPVSSWALSEFCDHNKVSIKDGFTKAVAQKLSRPSTLLPQIKPSGTWFDKVIAYMRAKSCFISRHPDCRNIVYLEGVDPHGSVNSDVPNQFNDLRIVFAIGDDGVPTFSQSVWEGTTEPGRVWTMTPMNRKGAARIAFNQYKAWVVGVHHPGQRSAHEALVQVEPITVCRDFNKDFKRTGDELDTGLFFINQHWGYDAPKDDLGNTSAGCLVGRTRDGHRAFMDLIKRDPRYKVNHGYRFMTAVMPGDEVLA